MHCVIGLRNPGAEYRGTRHNVGFDVVSHVLERADQRWGRGPSRLRSMVAQTGSGDLRTIFVAPNTYMNESGSAVRATIDYYGIPLESALVVHDDIDLPFGRLRLQVGGGNGGHNGVRSVEKAFGTAEFSRLKIGVGRPPGSLDPADFVLRNFSKSEEPDVISMIGDAADVVEVWVTDPVRAQEIAARRDKP